MPESPKPLRIFLSHAPADILSVRTLNDYLREKGFDVWFDKGNLFPAHHWQLEINEGLNNSDVLIVCLSKASISETGSIHRQITSAIDRALKMPKGRMFLIAVRMDSCKVPDSLNGYHWVDIFEQAGQADLLSELQHYAAQPQYVPSDVADVAPRAPIPKPVSEPVASVSVSKPPHVNEAWTQLRRTGVFLGSFLSFLGIGCLLLWLSTSIFVPLGTVPTTAPLRIATGTPAAGGGMLSKIDGMMLRYVPAGEFTMGSTLEADLILCLTLRPNCWLDSFKDETPPHKVYIDTFWMDETEVTNRMYALCVAAGDCQAPSQKNIDIVIYYGNPGFDDYPVFHVAWDDADTYCKWAGRQLPNEAQWEKAARGLDGRAYPWGDDPPNANLLNYGSYDAGQPTRAGKYQLGASPYGVLDMAGNLWEWVYDWYAVYPGGDEFASPDFGQTYRVARGGAMNSDRFDVRATIRNRYFPDHGYDNVGFRCVLFP